MSLDIFEAYATDETLEIEGTWFPIGKGAKLLVARAGNRAFSKLLQKEADRFRAVLDQNDDVADAKSDEILIDVLARTVLLGWEGIAFQGEDLTYSLANAKKVLAVKDFRRQVQKLADDMESFRVKTEAAQGEV